MQCKFKGRVKKTMSEKMFTTLCFFLSRKMTTYASNRNSRALPSPCARAEVS